MEALGSYPILKSFLAGSFSGTFSTILFQPLDLVKTRLQGCKKCGMLSTTISIIQKENVFGLWKGVTPVCKQFYIYTVTKNLETLCSCGTDKNVSKLLAGSSVTRVIPGVGLYFSTLHWLKTSLDLNDPLTPFQAVSLGITARSIAGSLLIPITVVKTRYESGVYKYNSIGEALKLIHKTEGIKGLSSGLVPTLLRDAPYSGLYLMFYTQLKNFVSENYSMYSNLPATHFSCGIFAGVFASIVTHPADVIKTKMQLYPNEFTSVKSSIYFVYYKHGVLGYFNGIVPRMLRRTLMTAMAWTVYEQITKSIGLK